MHDRIAPIAFLSLIVGAAILGVHFRRLPGWHHLAVYSLLTSGIAFVCLLALANSLESRVLTGLWQRLMLASLFLWCAVIGLGAYRSAASPRPNREPHETM
jgi:hypothetical protein